MRSGSGVAHLHVPPQVSEMVRKLHQAAPPTFGADLIQELVESFGRCPRWSGRQAFVFVCQVRAPFTAALSLRAGLCYLGTPPPGPRAPSSGRWCLESRLSEGERAARPPRPGHRSASPRALLRHGKFLSARDIGVKVVAGL